MATSGEIAVNAEGLNAYGQELAAWEEDIRGFQAELDTMQVSQTSKARSLASTRGIKEGTESWDALMFTAELSLAPYRGVLAGQLADFEMMRASQEAPEEFAEFRSQVRAGEGGGELGSQDASSAPSDTQMDPNSALDQATMYGMEAMVDTVVGTIASEATVAAMASNPTSIAVLGNFAALAPALVADLATSFAGSAMLGTRSTPDFGVLGTLAEAALSLFGVDVSLSGSSDFGYDVFGVPGVGKTDVADFSYDFDADFGSDGGFSGDLGGLDASGGMGESPGGPVGADVGGGIGLA